MRLPSIRLALFALIVAAPAFAQQQVKSRVMVLVDTSGSMVWHFGDNDTAGGDGDLASRYVDGRAANLPPGHNYYPGDALGGGLYDGVNSRLYAAKQAVTNVVNSTGNIDFGLMRYRMSLSLIGGLPRCPDLNNCCTFASGACVCHGDYHLPAASSLHCSTAQTTNAGYVTWSGGCGVISGGVAVDGAQILSLPSAISAREVLEWVDGVEDFRDRGDGWPRNGELRAAGPTPLAGSARSAMNNWYLPILNHTRANPGCDPATDPLCDPQIDCRPYTFVILTDGADSCEGCTSSSGNCAHASQQSNPPAVVQQLYLANGMNPVKTYVIGLAFVPGSPARTVLDEMAREGGTGSARFADSQGAIESAFADIVADSVKYEICNGMDDDCDGLTDEGFDLGATCSLGTGACLRTGVKKCAPAGSGTACCVDDGQNACMLLAAGPPGAEICNGIDDDCDGLIDENGVCQQCSPTVEVCDGKDNDCDGVIDNDLIDTEQLCGFSVGNCRRGRTKCVADAGKTFPDPTDHLICSGAVQPKTEICDGIDNDCDGVTDGLYRACYTGPAGTEDVGICHGGQQACTSPVNSRMEEWGTCAGQVLPDAELCNGLDDDCDGVVDDAPGVGMTCCPSGRCGTGICRQGTMQCSGGRVECVGGVGPQGELCNGVDDDCNGAVDDLPSIGRPCQTVGACAGTFACNLQTMQLECEGATGGAADETCNGLDDDCDGRVDEEPDVSQHDARLGQPCGPGAGRPMPCTAGRTICRAGQVVCDGGKGPTYEVCDCRDNDCNAKVDDDAVCPSGTACIDCGCYAPCGKGEFPCPGGYYCDEQKGRYCLPEKDCPPCPTGTRCDVATGTCVDRCEGVRCPPTYACMNGQCVGTSCAELGGCAECVDGQGERCDVVDRRCVTDPCCGKSCLAGEFCEPRDGACVGVCLVPCRSDRICVNGQCVPDPCEGVRCPGGYVCNPKDGMCAPDRCRTVTCVAGFTCVDGRCAQDLCEFVSCPAGFRCVTSSLDGSHACEKIPERDDTDRVVGAGGGGVALGCSTGGRSSAPRDASALVALALAIIAIRRRSNSG